jgi:hypothetical protein
VKAAAALAVFLTFVGFASAFAQETTSSHGDLVRSFLKDVRRGNPSSSVKMIFIREHVTNDLSVPDARVILAACKEGNLKEERIFGPVGSDSSPELFVTTEFSCRAPYYSATGTVAVFSFREEKLSRFLFQVGGFRAPPSKKSK